ncbi:MAG: phosphatidate cytidylyltransferase [bacterium]|nr:phosphatidate cytidylyltransferase [bacterium]
MDCRRLITGIVVGFTAFFSMLAGGIWLSLLILGASFYLAKEYTEILKHKGFLPSFKIIVISNILFATAAYLAKPEYVLFIVTLSSLMALLSVLFKGKQPYIANVATTVFGFIYCGWFPLHLILLRHIGNTSPSSFIPYPEGANYCLVILFSVLLTDTFCYFTGIKFGKHKLAPVISPNKTIEGSIGGALFGIISAVIVGIMLCIPWYHAMILGLIISASAQLGDLCESMIKRDAGVKDSSNILPGHGGFLDRLDSYILTIPIVYYYALYIINFKGWF